MLLILSIGFFFLYFFVFGFLNVVLSIGEIRIIWLGWFSCFFFNICVKVNVICFLVEFLMMIKFLGLLILVSNCLYIFVNNLNVVW